MKKILLMLTLAVSSWAQLYPPNEAGVTMGAWHLIVRDLDAAKNFWVLVGAKPIQIDGADAMKLPGVFIFLSQGSPSGPSEGSSVDHVGVKITIGKAFQDRLKAAGVRMSRTDPVTGRTAGYVPGKNRNWGYAYTSDGMTLEILDSVMMGGDAPLKIYSLPVRDNNDNLPPVESDHVHIYVPDKASIAAAQDWYGKLFGAPAFTDTGGGVMLPGSRLRMQNSAAGKPAPVPSKGRAVDYIGFEVKNLGTFCKKLEANGVKFDEPYSKTRHASYASARFTDPWGTGVELTEGLIGFDFMKRLISILSFATLWPVAAAWAQLAPVNELGLSWGHLHLTAPDMEKEAKAWLALGGQLGLNVSVGIPITFPGILVSLRQGEISGGSEGSIVDHVAFRVPDLQASMARWHGPTVVGKVANWGLKTEPGTRPGQGFVTTPSLVKIEILEDKALKVPIAFDHAHFYVPESQLREIEDFYVKRFGATPVKGETDTLSLPGGKLIFSKSDKPAAPTMGRSLDHIGFNMANAEALAAFSKGLEANGVKFYRPYTNKAFGAAMVFDGFGTLIELTKGQRGYFDINDLEPGFYKFDAQGNPRQ